MDIGNYITPTDNYGIKVTMLMVSMMVYGNTITITVKYYINGSQDGPWGVYYDNGQLKQKEYYI